MKHVTLLVFAAVALAACDTSPTAPAANRERPSLSAVTSQTNTVIPIDLFVFVPCANGGAVEVIGVSGPLHFLFQVTISNTGNVLVDAHFQPQGVSGTGFMTGDKYQATGITRSTDTFSTPFPITSTFVNNFYMIGQGPDNNFKVHETLHYTINANGEVTSFVDNFSVTCK